MKTVIACAAGIVMLLGASTAWAENQWSNYRGVDTAKQHPQPRIDNVLNHNILNRYIVS